MRANNSILDEYKEEIIALYNETTLKDVAKHYKCATKSVKKKLLEWGVKLHSKKAWNKGISPSKEQKEKFKLSISKTWTSEKKEKQRKKQKEIWSNPELLQKHSQIAKDLMTDEHKEKISIATRKAMGLPIVKKHIKDGIEKSFNTKKENGSFNTSKAEIELTNYIQSLGFNPQKFQIGQGDTRLEIDIYIPEKQLGFEYNGMFWHSDKYKDKNYHYHKTLLAKQNNINLIHIWEWEDLDKIKAFIHNLLIEKVKLNARDCECKEVPIQEANEFYSKYHLQGTVFAKDIKHYGLYYKNELVAMRSYAKPRFKSNKYDWEDIRYAVKSGYAIRGALSKLWKRKPEGRIVSYQNLDKFPNTNNSFEIEGFKYIKHSISCYYKSNMDSKPTTWKTRLNDWVKSHPEDSDCTTFDELLTKHNGYRIYNAGTVTWLYIPE